MAQNRFWFVENISFISVHCIVPFIGSVVVSLDPLNFLRMKILLNSFAGCLIFMIFFNAALFGIFTTIWTNNCSYSDFIENIFLEIFHSRNGSFSSKDVANRSS